VAEPRTGLGLRAALSPPATVLAGGQSEAPVSQHKKESKGWIQILALTHQLHELFFSVSFISFQMEVTRPHCVLSRLCKRRQQYTHLRVTRCLGFAKPFTVHTVPSITPSHSHPDKETAVGGASSSTYQEGQEVGIKSCF
jgi:hypothetical protein